MKLITLIRKNLIIPAPILAVLLIAPAVHAQSYVGYVADVEGEWILDTHPQQMLARGQKLPAGASIQSHSQKEGDHIAIANLEGRIVKTGRCGRDRDCGQAISLADTKSKNSVWGVVVEKVMGIIYGRPDEVNVNVPSRGTAGELQESIVQLKDGQLDLNAVFTKMRADRYYIKLWTISDKGETGTRKAIGPTTIDWEPTKPALIQSKEIKPGLYEVVLLKPKGKEYVSTPVTGWILVSLPGEYVKTSASFKQAKALTESWGHQVEPEAAHTFLRAYLDYVSTQSTR